MRSTAMTMTEPARKGAALAIIGAIVAVSAWLHRPVSPDPLTAAHVMPSALPAPVQSAQASLLRVSPRSDPGRIRARPASYQGRTRVRPGSDPIATVAVGMVAGSDQGQIRVVPGSDPEELAAAHILTADDAPVLPPPVTTTAEAPDAGVAGQISGAFTTAGRQIGSALRLTGDALRIAFHP